MAHFSKTDNLKLIHFAGSYCHFHALHFVGTVSSYHLGQLLALLLGLRFSSGSERLQWWSEKSSPQWLPSIHMSPFVTSITPYILLINSSSTLDRVSLINCDILSRQEVLVKNLVNNWTNVGHQSSLKALIVLTTSDYMCIPFSIHVYTIL